jgi:hypothetical protein
MKHKKLTLTAPKVSKLYSFRKPFFGFPTEQSQNTDVTTTCTSILTSTHLNKV